MGEPTPPPEPSQPPKEFRAPEIPGVKDRMLGLMTNVEAENNKLGGKLCASFGEGDGKALIFATEPRIPLAEAKRVPEGYMMLGSTPDLARFTVANRDGFYEFTVNDPETYEYLDELITTRQDEQQREVPAKPNTGLRSQMRELYRLRVKDPTQPLNTTEPVDLDIVRPANPDRLEVKSMRFEAGEGERGRAATGFFANAGQEGYARLYKGTQSGDIVDCSYGHLTDESEIVTRISKAQEIAQRRLAEEQRMLQEAQEAEAKRVAAEQASADTVINVANKIDQLFGGPSTPEQPVPPDNSPI